MARKCDEIRNKTPLEKRSSLGLLYGIPISVKECIAQKGYDCTMGYASNLNKPYNFDAASLVLL
jgi:Asp-tRNA(Asn)/Glu-tRNA(Gln) amidotransferase A subunit family amidase